MRILIVPSWYFPAGSRAIAGRMFHHLAKGLIEHGVEASIFYADYSKKGPWLGKKIESNEEGVPTYRVERWFPPKANALLINKWISRGSKDLLTYIEKIDRPEVLHAQSYFAAAICNEVSKKTGIPVIYTERLSSFITKEIPDFHIPVIKSAFSESRVITCVSPGLMDRLQAHAHKPIKLIPNFYDKAIFFPDPAIDKYESFTFISVGEPAKTKGLDLLLKAYALVKEKFSSIPMQLILVDEIPEKDELMKLAGDLGISNQLVWKGLISQKELAELFQRSHLYVSASRVETFGKAIIEAMACGLPVVATKTDGARYILSSYQLGELVELNDVNALHRSMGKLFAGYKQFKAADIQMSVEKRFSKKAIIPQWIKLYQSLLT